VGFQDSVITNDLTFYKAQKEIRETWAHKSNRFLKARKVIQDHKVNKNQKEIKVILEQLNLLQI
jgi:hypothetical protein